MNLKCDFQNGGHEIENSIFFSETLYSEVFVVVNYRSEIIFF